MTETAYITQPSIRDLTPREARRLVCPECEHGIRLTAFDGEGALCPTCGTGIELYAKVSPDGFDDD